jgi:hypothetical protein
MIRKNFKKYLKNSKEENQGQTDQIKEFDPLSKTTNSEAQ